MLTRLHPWGRFREWGLGFGYERSQFPLVGVFRLSGLGLVVWGWIWFGFVFVIFLRRWLGGVVLAGASLVLEDEHG